MGAEFAPNLTPDRSKLPHRNSPGLRRLAPVLVIARGPAGQLLGPGSVQPVRQSFALTRCREAPFGAEDVPSRLVLQVGFDWSRSAAR
jgi:hypothetical protein